MNKDGYIYKLTDEEMAAFRDEIKPLNETEAVMFDEMRQDVARLDGYLRGRADSDAVKRGPGSNKDLAG